MYSRTKPSHPFPLYLPFPPFLQTIVLPPERRLFFFCEVVYRSPLRLSWLSDASIFAGGRFPTSRSQVLGARVVQARKLVLS